MKILRRLLKFAVPYWPKYVAAFALVFGVSALNLLEPMVIKWVIDDILKSQNYSLLLYGALGILGVAIVRGVLQFFQRFSMSYAGQEVVFDIRNTLYRHLQQLSYSFRPAQTGQIMSRVTSDGDQRFLSNGLVQMVSMFVTFTATFALMVSQHASSLYGIDSVPFGLAFVTHSGETTFWGIQQQLAVLAQGCEMYRSTRR